jgi:hypothetical protein
MDTRFVVFAMARSGSGHLCDQLRAQSRDVGGLADIASRFSGPETVRAFLSDQGLTHWACETDISFESLP